MSAPEFPADGRNGKDSNPEPDIIFLDHDYLDDPVIHLPCYEPSGLSIDLRVGDVLRHVLILGQTGSGKTTLNNRLCQDLINYRSSTTDAPAGLLILDAQGDGTVERIRKMAAAAGRLDDVRVLSATEGYFDPMGRLASFADLDHITSSLISATDFATSHQEHNAYWAEQTRLLIESGLTVLLLAESSLTLHKILNFLSGLLVQGEKWPDEVKATVEKFDRIVKLAPPTIAPGICAKLALIRATLTGWKSLDSRTRSILQTCAGLVIAPFLSAQALPYWDPGKGAKIDPADALDGKIVVLSMRGSSEPETAALLSRLFKIEFYRAAQSRMNSVNQPLAGIIMDEFPLCVTTGSPRWSDISNLATLRGKGVFVIAATQGLVNLDLVIGEAQTRALLTNFSNVIFLRSQETGFLYEFARKICGNKPVQSRPHGSLSEIGNLILVNPDGVQLTRYVPVCPEGALARLQPHQAYVALASGYRTLGPVWLAPLFFPQTPVIEERTGDRDLALLRHAEGIEIDPTLPEPILEVCSLQLYHVLLAHPRRTRAVMTATDLLAGLKAMRHLVALSEAETIPPCWRPACLRLAAELPKNFKIIELRCDEGRLKVEFLAQNVPGSNINLDDLRNLADRWQKSVYPSRVRWPHWSDLLWLEDHFPGLIPDDDDDPTPNGLNKKINPSNEEQQ